MNLKSKSPVLAVFTQMVSLISAMRLGFPPAEIWASRHLDAMLATRSLNLSP